MALKLKAGGSVFSVSATTGKLSCECCCYPTCPSPTIQWKSRSASKTKCGFGAYILIGAVSRRFLLNSRYGSTTICGLTRTWGGSLTYNPVACSFSGSTTEVYTGSSGPPCSGTEGTTLATFETYLTVTAYGTNGSGVLTEDLTDEYLTATLKTNTTAALSAYTATWTGTAGSYFNLTTDELTNSIRQAKYRFQFTVPEMCGAAMCYKIEWTEGSTAMSYTYTGTDPAGTTLYTGEYEIAIPTTNSTVTVTGITSACTGC